MKELSLDLSEHEARTVLLRRANEIHRLAIERGDLASAVEALRLVAELQEAAGRVFGQL